MLGMSGCAFFSEQATLIHYDPSDGIGASVGSIDVRNALVLTKDGETGSLLVNFVNESSDPVNLKLQYDSSNGEVSKYVSIPGSATVSYGGSDDTQFVLTDMGTKPGKLFKIWVQYGSHTGVQMPVPVLDGTWQTYKGLLPTLSPTPTPTPTTTVLPVIPTAPATPSATPTP
jgi:hypothetical protein